MGDDLIERLRKPWDYTDGRRVLICEEAAARITELEADLARLRAENVQNLHELEMLKADFNDCNSERARHAARAVFTDAPSNVTLPDAFLRALDAIAQRNGGKT